MASDDSSVKSGKRTVSPLLIVLLVVLAAAVVALITDRLARRGAQKAYDRISQRLPGDGDVEIGKASSEAAKLEDVRRLAGREPDEAAVPLGSELLETYTWRGPFKRYTVYVVYQKGAVPMLLRATLNQPPPSVPDAPRHGQQEE